MSEKKQATKVRTIALQPEGRKPKYEFDLNEHGLMVAARRHGVDWEVALHDFRYHNCFMAALYRIEELEDEAPQIEAIRLVHALGVEVDNSAGTRPDQRKAIDELGEWLRRRR